MEQDVVDAGMAYWVDDETVLQGLSHIDALRRAVQDQATAGLATASTAR
jgi:hypothetical protein